MANTDLVSKYMCPPPKKSVCRKDPGISQNVSTRTFTDSERMDRKVSAKVLHTRAHRHTLAAVTHITEYLQVRTLEQMMV